MDSPIFVMGTARSGTTLTANILGKHSGLFMPGENHFFEDIYTRRSEIGDPKQVGNRTDLVQRMRSIYGRYNQNEDQERVDELFNKSDDFQQKLMECSDYSSMLSAFMSFQMKQEGKIRWGNNTPKDIFHIDEILTFYPNAKVIVLVRDARDFALSYKNRWKVTTLAHKERLKKLYHPMITSVLWKTSVRSIDYVKRVVPESNLAIIQYEALVRNPEDTIREICKVVEEEFEPDMLNIDSNNSSDSQSSGGIFSSSVGRWQEKLSNEEAFVVQNLTSRELLEYGYTIEKININWFKTAWLGLSAPFALIRGLMANRKNRGPLMPYLAKRITALFGRH